MQLASIILTVAILCHVSRTLLDARCLMGDEDGKEDEGDRELDVMVVQLLGGTYRVFRDCIDNENCVVSVSSERR